MECKRDPIHALPIDESDPNQEIIEQEYRRQTVPRQRTAKKATRRPKSSKKRV